MYISTFDKRNSQVFIYYNYRLQYSDIINAQCYMKKTPIIHIINHPNIKIAGRVCTFLKKCHNIRKKIFQHI